MPDWSAYVRGRLPRLHVPPERESEIVAELALQLDQTYTETLAGGASEADALRRAEAQFADWHTLSRDIEAAEARIAMRLEPSHGGALAGWWQSSAPRGPLPSLALAAFAALASYIPASKAARIDPLAALRRE
jgi:hypothetical protein